MDEKRLSLVYAALAAVAGAASAYAPKAGAFVLAVAIAAGSASYFKKEAVFKEHRNGLLAMYFMLWVVVWAIATN